MSSKKHTLNFDGSHNNQANTASAGCIIRDDKGDLIVAAAYNLTKTNLPCYNVAISEAIGLRNGLQLARQHSISLKLIKGDNKQVIDLVQGQSRRLPGPPLNGIIEEIKIMLSQGFVEVKLINGEDNKVADKLAYIGSLLVLTDFKVFTRFNSPDLSPQVTELINREKILFSTKKGPDYEDGNSSLATIATVGAGIAGVATLAWGVYKLFSGESSSSSTDHKTEAFQVPKPRDIPTNNPAPRSSSRPSPTLYTLQYFGSDRNQLPKASAGCIIKNSRGGEFRIAAAYNLDNQYPNCHVAIAEAIALKNGLKLAQVNNIRLNIIQGRNVEVRTRVLDLEKRPPKSRDLIQFINQIKMSLSEQSIFNLEDTLEHVEEDNIKVARDLATVGCKLQQETVIYYSSHDLPFDHDF